MCWSLITKPLSGESGEPKENTAPDAIDVFIDHGFFQFVLQGKAPASRQRR
jgi:hypothetical protein